MIKYEKIRLSSGDGQTFTTLMRRAGECSVPVTAITTCLELDAVHCQALDPADAGACFVALIRAGWTVHLLDTSTEQSLPLLHSLMRADRGAMAGLMQSLIRNFLSD